MALFRVNGLIQPEAYRSDTVQKTFWHGDVQPEGQGDDFVQGTAAPGQGISSGETRGRAEKEPRLSIPVPAVPVSELLAGKNRKICKSLN